MAAYEVALEAAPDADTPVAPSEVLQVLCKLLSIDAAEIRQLEDDRFEQAGDDTE